MRRATGITKNELSLRARLGSLAANPRKSEPPRASEDPPAPMHTRRLIWSAPAGPSSPVAMRAMAANAEAGPPQSAIAEAPQHDTPLTGLDEAIFLLHIGAEIEHSLMVQ